MAALPLEINPLESLGSESDFTVVGAGEEILLTPYLTLACALLYMMAADGKLGDQESSHLQGVLGGDDKVLAYAVRYVQTVPLDKFLIDAPEVLSTKDKWCILVNVCDALLSDGHADEEELALFARLTTAFGISEQTFKPYLKILTLKNDKTVLGRYTGVKEERQSMTPHFALAVSLLYMLTADGSIGAEEIGQLEAVIGEFDGLQAVALKYVRSVKLKPFLSEAAVVLKPEQKIYILTNVCDSMMADGSVARLEDKVFVSMLNGFGITEKSFAIYQKVIETKNFKPFDCTFKNRSMQTLGIGGANGDGPTVQNEQAGANGQKIASDGLGDAANQGVWDASNEELVMSSFISKTMQENIQSVKDDFGSQDNVVQIGRNATDELNLQKIDADGGEKNRQKLGDDVGPDNRQKLDDQSDLKNRQKLSQEAEGLNRQQLLDEQIAANHQTIDLNASGVNRAVIPPEVRMQNIEEVVQEVTERLDSFEQKNYSFLQIGRVERYDDSFALIDESDSGLNRQLINESYARMGIGAFFAKAASTAQAVDATLGSNQLIHMTSHQQVHADGALMSHLKNSEMGAKSKRQKVRSSAWPQQALGSARHKKLNFVHLFAAFALLTFAAPISTKPVLSRAAIGHLVVIYSEVAAQQALVDQALTPSDR
jgi:uncharacterized tellurite resistance protein B-like protein